MSLRMGNEALDVMVFMMSELWSETRSLDEVQLRRFKKVNIEHR